MSLSSLFRRTEKATDFVYQHYQTGVPPSLASGFDFDMYDEDEQERLHAMIALIEPQLRWQQTSQGRWWPIVAGLSTQERDLFESWVTLQHALYEGDTTLSERTRRYLTLTEADKETIREAFLALDEQGLPEVRHCTEAPVLVWDKATRYLSRAALRSAKDHIRQPIVYHSYLRRYELEEMWMWLEVYEQP